MTSIYKDHVDLVNLYNLLWNQAFEQFSKGTCAVDEQLVGRLKDDRTGITLLARLPVSVFNRIQPLLQGLNSQFPKQYVVPEEDLHITILSIEPVRSGFCAEPQMVSSIVESVEKSIRYQKPFSIELFGISASPSAVFICGYPTDKTLNSFRNKVRGLCWNKGFGKDMDNRYKLRGAHFTVLRFIRPNLSEAQVGWLQSMRTIPLGCHNLSTIELVLSDWYMRQRSISLFRRWNLKNEAEV